MLNAESNGESMQARESLIATAIHFLENPNVRHSPLSQKQKFLRSKGLTEDEIQIACERAGVFSVDPNNSTVISMGISTSSSAPTKSKSTSDLPQTMRNYYNHNQQQQLIQKPSLFSHIKDILKSMAIYSTVAYFCYLFYKKYIEPILFGKKRKKTLEEINEKIEIQIKEINQEVIRIREDISRNSQNESITREISNIKSDLDAIKGLLLNRKQFANPLPVVPPSIPAWQLTSQSHHTETENEPDKNDDAGSGSGSSETEVVTKNSDSSLEIM